MCVAFMCLFDYIFVSQPLSARRFPLAYSTKSTAFGSLLSFKRVICPVQRSWEAVRVASMLNILARLKTAIFRMWPLHEIRRICRRCRRCTWERFRECMSLLSTVVLEAQLPCTPCTLWRLYYHVVTIHASRVLQRLHRQLEYGC